MNDRELADVVELSLRGVVQDARVTRIETEPLGVLEDGSVVCEKTVFVSVQPIQAVERATITGNLFPT